MRIKFILPIFLVLLSIGVVYAQSSAQKEAPGSDVGRYQLFNGTYGGLNIKTGETTTHTVILLIDTKTGKVKRYLNMIDQEGKYIETWVPTDAPPEKR